jgi:hypothetical protein
MSTYIKPVTASLEIKRISDGMIRRDPKSWDYYNDFIWSEGNFACDCNRSDFFARAVGETEDDNSPCGDELFSVRLSDLDGLVLYQDGSW